MPSKEEIEEAKGWLAALDIGSEYGATSKEIILSYIEQLEAEKKNAIEAYKSEKNMKNTYVSLYQDILLKENVIPKQLIKEKIKKYQKLKEDIEAEGYDADYTEGKIDVLQELMKGE